MKLKIDLKSFSLENAMAWLAAIASVVVIFGAGHAFIAWYVSKYDDLKSIKATDPKALEQMEKSLIEPVPTTASLESERAIDAMADSAAGIPKKIEGAPKEPLEPIADNNPYEIWSYERDRGPEAWGKLSEDFILCRTGQKQSPINLSSKSPYSRNLAPLLFSYLNSHGELTNDTRVLKLALSNGGVLRAFNQTYRLEGIDFHIPSEHRVDGKAYDMEFQLRHRGDHGDQLVVSIFGHETNVSHSELAKIWSDLPKKIDHPIEVTGFNAAQLLPEGPQIAKQYFAYEGSLTTPPCEEKVHWIILVKPIKVASAQVDRLLNVTRFNARPVQAIGARNILRSW